MKSQADDRTPSDRLIFILALPDRPNRTSQRSDIASSSNPPRITTKRGIAATLTILTHILLFIYTIPSGDSTDDIVLIITVNINMMVVNLLTSAATALAYICQTYTTVRRNDTGALSTTTLGLHVTVSAALAATWPFRLVLDEDLWPPEGWVWTWYRWVGWACVNSAIAAMGQAIVLSAALGVGTGTSTSSGESQPLLADQ